MAPIEATGDDADPLHGLIRQFAKEQASHEHDRLLYVAATRAKQHLHLCYELKRNHEGELSPPRKGSLLHRLWPVVEAECSLFDGPPGTAEAREDWVQPHIHRFPVEWQAAAAPAALKFAAQAPPAEEQLQVTFDWAGSDAMRVGLVVHRCLQYIAEQKLPDWADADAVHRMLVEEGVSPDRTDSAAEKVMAALKGTHADEQGRWILADYAEAACEFPLTINANGKAERLVIDRCFVDDEGIRWIVDYKTSSHEGGNLEGFVDSEVERYAEQLGRYRHAMQLLEPERTIRTALYFPLLGLFREVSA
jgi:ATP-dependent exoDNAse (exonuclease V) beta subunit